MKKIRQLPINIKFPERVRLDGGAVFVTLRTMDEFEVFWNEHRHEYPYAAEETSCSDNPTFLSENEWVFATSKSILVKTVMRWEGIGIRCEWYDWAGDNPREHASFFEERDDYRAKEIENRTWNDSNERAYQEDCLLRNQETYRGYWQLINLPLDIPFCEWFSSCYDEIIDAALSDASVTKMFQEKTFDDWKEDHPAWIDFHDTESIDRQIVYWRNEKRRGETTTALNLKQFAIS